MSATTTLSAKGQVVILADVRRALRLNAGQALRVTQTENGVLLTPVQPKSGRSTAELIAEMRKLYTHEGPPVSIEEMDRAVGRMFAAQGRHV